MESRLPLRRELAEVGSLAGAVGAAVTSAAAALCCVGPLALTLLGVNGMILAAGIKPYRFHLLFASLVLLSLAFWVVYHPLRAGAAACSTRSARLTRAVLWLAALVWLAAFVLQFVTDTLTV